MVARPDPMKTFLKQFVSYAAGSIASSLVVYGAMSGGSVSPSGIVFAFIVAPLILLLPIAVLGLALKRGSIGGVLGALCGIPLLLLWQDIHMRIEAREILAEDQRKLAPIQRRHELIAIENSYFSAMKNADGCSEYCLQILFQGDRIVAVKDLSEDLWRVFRLAHGDTCRNSPRQSRYLELLGRGYADTCISMTIEPLQTDVLIIREYFYQQAARREETRPFNVSKREIVERVGGNERLLGRWIAGVVEPTSGVFYYFGLQARKVGTPIDDREVYEAALGFPMQEFLPSGNARASVILEELRPFFEDRDMSNWAMYAFERVARRSDDADRALCRDFIMARAAELKASLDADPAQLRWFEGWASRL